MHLYFYSLLCVLGPVGFLMQGALNSLFQKTKKNHAQMGDRVDDLLERSVSKSHRFRSIEDDPFVFNVVEKAK
jgi:hypothetical protein